MLSLKNIKIKTEFRTSFIYEVGLKRNKIQFIQYKFFFTNVEKKNVAIIE